MSEVSIIKLGKSNSKSISKTAKKKLAAKLRKTTKTRDIDYNYYPGDLVRGCNHRDEESLGSSGNPCEGGSVFFKCRTCGKIRESSEDGTVYHPKGYKPYFRTIADDMRRAGINPETASDDDVVRFLGGE